MSCRNFDGKRLLICIAALLTAGVLAVLPLSAAVQLRILAGGTASYVPDGGISEVLQSSGWKLEQTGDDTRISNTLTGITETINRSNAQRYHQNLTQAGILYYVGYDFDYSPEVTAGNYIAVLDFSAADITVFAKDFLTPYAPVLGCSSDKFYFDAKIDYTEDVRIYIFGSEEYTLRRVTVNRTNVKGVRLIAPFRNETSVVFERGSLGIRVKFPIELDVSGVNFTVTEAGGLEGLELDDQATGDFNIAGTLWNFRNNNLRFLAEQNADRSVQLERYVDSYLRSKDYNSDYQIVRGLSLKVGRSDGAAVYFSAATAGNGKVSAEIFTYDDPEMSALSRYLSILSRDGDELFHYASDLGNRGTVTANYETRSFVCSHGENGVF